MKHTHQFPAEPQSFLYFPHQNNLSLCHCASQSHGSGAAVTQAIVMLGFDHFLSLLKESDSLQLLLKQENRSAPPKKLEDCVLPGSFCNRENTKITPWQSILWTFHVFVQVPRLFSYWTGAQQQTLAMTPVLCSSCCVPPGYSQGNSFLPQPPWAATGGNGTFTESSAPWHRSPTQRELLPWALTPSQLHNTTSDFLLLPNPLKHRHISKQAFVLAPATHSSSTGFLFLSHWLLVYPRAFSNRTFTPYLVLVGGGLEEPQHHTALEGNTNKQGFISRCEQNNCLIPQSTSLRN